MTDQVVWSGETRTEVSKLVVATNELTSKVITLLNAISGNFDGLVEQLEEATSAVNGGVADLSIIKADIEGSIRRAQEDMGNIYQSFLAESSDIKSSLSGLSTEADDLQLIMTTLNNTGTMLADKYNLLNATAAEVGNSVLLYKNQAGTIQESILSVESRAATISANLDRISEMAQVNTESSEEFMKEIANMQIEVYKLSSSVMEYKELADSLVENYTNLKQVAEEAQTMATAAHNDAVNATDKITAIADQYGDLSCTVESIKTLISEYNSIAADITSQLSSSSGELTAMRSTVNEFSDYISSTISTVETNISTLISKVSSLTIKVDDLTSKVDSASETIYSIKSMVDIQLQDAISVIANATNTASYIEGVVATNKTTVEDCLAVLGVAKTDTNLVLDNMTAYKAEVEQLYSDTMGHLSTVESNLAVLDGKTATVTEQLNSALSTLTSISEHVDGVSAHVDEIASTVETTYLKKVDQAVDSALLSGKAIDYFLHDDNRETKLSTSPTIQQMQTAISNINDVIQSDTGTLDTLQEIVDFIKLNKENLDNPTIGNIAGLQTALDGKLATDANAVSASKWVAARKITLGGALTGSVDVDGGSDVILNASIVSINDVPGLVDAMADKLDKNAAVADSSKLGGIDAARFFFGDTSANVKAILSADLDGLSQSGFYRVTDANQSVVYIHGDADSAVRITYDYATSHLYYKEKVSGVWSATSFKVLSDASRLDFTKLDNVPGFATRANTWDEVTGKPTVFAPDVHNHVWADITDKPTTFTPGVHSHYWDDILSKPTTFLAAPHEHYSVVSEGLLAEVSGTESITYPGVSMVEAKASNKYVGGTKEGTVLNLKGDAQSQLMVSGNSGTKPSLLIRSKSYDVDAIWSEWAKVFSSQDAPTWSDIASKPTTLAGFGITDGAPSTHVGAGGTAHSAASTSVAGFMSATDKVKLNGIAAGANAYVHPTGDGNLHVPITGTNSDGYVLRAGATAGSMVWSQLTAADVGALPSTWVPIFADIAYKPTTLSGYGITDAQPLDPDLTAIAGLAGTTGLLKKTAANTWALDTNTYLTNNKTITISGDATGSGTTAIALTLANSGATAGTYKSVTVDSKGRVTAGTNPTTLAGYGITDAAKTVAPFNFGGTQTAISTADFITQLTNLGAFNTLYWCTKAAWSYADNNYITDTGLGSIQLAGCTVEVIGYESAYTIRIHTAPDVSIGSAVSDADFIYVNHGAEYLPKWHRIYSTAYKPTAADVGLGLVNNTSDLDKPISTATQTALSTKADTNHVHGVATQIAAGFMSSADKLKLDNLGSGGASDSANKLTTARRINGTLFDGTSDISTANWGTSRKITIGKVSQLVDGSSDVYWSPEELGCLPSTGGALSGNMSVEGWVSVVSADDPLGFCSFRVEDNVATINSNSRLTKGFRIKTGTTTCFLVDPTGELYANGSYKVYHTNNKPTASDVGALASTGGTVSGDLNVGGTIKLTNDIATVGLSNSFGRNIVRGSNVAVNVFGNATDAMYFDGNSLTAWQVRYGSTLYPIYHTGNKPTPAEIGALASGGTAAAATKLATARTIAGKSFNGTANISITATDVGALSTSGGTLSGGLNVGDAIKLTNSSSVGLLNSFGRTLIRGSTGPTNVIGNPTDAMYFDGNSLTAWQVRYNGTLYQIYHKGNKPTPAEIGAQPATSDIRVKSNIASLSPVLDKIMLIDPKTFTMEGRDGTCVGTIAQDWEVDFPEVILNVPSTSPGEPEMLKGIDALGTIGILLKAIQELKGEIEELKNR